MKISAKNVIWSIISISFGIIFFAFALLLLFWAGKEGYKFGEAVFTEKPMSTGLGKQIIVEIDADMSDRDVAKYIKAQGLVEDENVFYVQILLSDYRKKYIQGKYELNTNMKPTQILEVICSGEFYIEPTVPEEPTEEGTTGEEPADDAEGTQEGN